MLKNTDESQKNLVLTKLNQLFKQTNFRTLTQEEELAVSAHYRREILAGLDDPKASSVKMFPSLLEPVSLKSLHDGQEALVVEIGGTNLYAARVVIKDGKPIVTADIKDTLSTRHFLDADEFFHTLAKGIAPIASGIKPLALGIVYSFPGKAFKAPNGVDVMSPEKLTKGFIIPGISAKPVGEGLRNALTQQWNLPKTLPTAVLNDTVAVLFAANAKIGGAIGTGCNFAFQTDRGIVNSESGNFMLQYGHEFADQVDRRSENQGLQLAEKQISGMYLELQIQLILQRLHAEKLVSPKAPTALSCQEMSDYLINSSDDLDTHVILQAIGLLRDRSAQIASILISTVINTFPAVFVETNIQIPITGSVFWNMPEYRDILIKTISKLTRKDISFPLINNAGQIGAAVAALGFV